jgi:methionyl-tRNA formyltransferase
MAAPARVVFMGSKSGGLALCRLLCEDASLAPPVLVLCPDDRADERSCLPEFEALCTRHGVPLRCVNGGDEVAAELTRAAPTLVLVHGWYRLIPIERCPGAQFFGFHYSPLPAYRGNAPLVWQILRGEPRLGISFFRFGGGIDDGDLVAQHMFDLGPDETIADALRHADAACLAVARDGLPGLLTGTRTLQPQPEVGASYCGRRIPEDGLIDWSQHADRVHDFVRAQTRPYPGAFSVQPDGRRLRIWRTARDPRRFFGTPGAVLAVDGQAVLVACGGDSALRILACGWDGHADASPAVLIGSLRTRLGAGPSGGPDAAA